MFDIRELRQLLSIDEFRHFGRAAQAMGLSQPALTKSLQRMEDALGAKLFERSRARVVPTAIGVEVLTRARRLVDDASELKRTVDSMASAEQGTLAVGIGPAMAETYVAAAIASVVQERPHTQISVRVDHWRQLSTWLLDGEIEFYVADVGEARIDGRFQYTPLPAEKFVWFCCCTHPLAARMGRPVTRNELTQFPIATPKMPPWALEWFAAACGEKGVAGLPQPFPTIECESYVTLKRIVSSSDCISAALEVTLSKELADGSFIVLNVDAPVLTTHAGIIQLRDRTPSPLATELMKCIENSAQQMRPSAQTRPLDGVAS